MASARQQTLRLDAQTIEKLRAQIEANIRSDERTSKVKVLELVPREFKRQDSRSYRSGGPIDIVVANEGGGNVPTQLWIKTADFPHSGFYEELWRLYELARERELAGLIPRPYAFDPDTALLVTELVQGSCPLKSFLKSAAIGDTDSIVKLARSSGQWLAHFHSLNWRSDGPTIEVWTNMLLEKMIASRLYPREVVELLESSSDLASVRDTRLPITRLHKDFALRNILCTDDRLNVIDWDAMGHPATPDTDTPWNDIGAFLINIESQIRYFPLIRHEYLRLFEQAMLDMYRETCPGPIGPVRLVTLLIRLRYDVELIGPPLSRAYTGSRGRLFRRLFRRRLCREIRSLRA